jgi:succinate dehydrogenase/fumarate reductase flavoprotein subunit
VVDDACQTGVPGLFAIGDTATREPVAGATSGGGAQNSAWALSSGIWAGRAAAALAAAGRTDRPASRTGVSVRQGAASAKAIAATVRDEMLDYDRNLFRTADKLRHSLDVLDGLWETARHGIDGDPVAARSATALIASGRWSWSSALARTESRGLHQRLDRPGTDQRQSSRLIVGGLDRISVRPERPPVRLEQLA